MLRAYCYRITLAEYHDTEGFPCRRECTCVERVQLDELVFSVFIIALDFADAGLGSQDVDALDAYFIRGLVEEYLTFTPPRRILSHC